MISKKMQAHIEEISQEAMHILKISGRGKDSKETYERAKATLEMIDIAVRMLISEIEPVRTSKK